MSTDTNKCPTQHVVGPTPGPWHLNRAIRGRLYVEAEGPVVICDMQLEACVAATRGITEADARLIAAAPELWAALQRTLDRLRWYTAEQETCDVSYADEIAIEQAEAAIAKATGAEGQVTP